MSLNRLLCALLALVLCTPAFDAGPERRNVVLFVTDDQGIAAGCYGDPDARTPHLDALSADGSRFESAFCTTASCSPSRAVILSGLHGHRNGTYGLQHRTHHFQSFDDVRSLPAVLRDAGWETATVGKLHVAPDSVYPFATKLRGSARNPVQMAESVGAWLAERGDEPFFLLVGTSDPHRGGGVAEDLPGRPDRFGNKDYPGVERVAFEPEALTVPAWLPDLPETRAELAQFHESVARADQGLGRLIEVLRAAEVWDETLFVFASDHGPAWPGAKTTAYEPGLRTSLVVRDPTQEARGLVVRELASLVDLMPTILEWCALEQPESRGGALHGRSLLTLLRGGDHDDWVDEVYASHTFHEVTMYYPMRVLRTPRYKLIWNIAHELPFPFASDLWAASTWRAALARGEEFRYGPRPIRAYLHRPRFELFDLEADPLEAANLAGDPAHAETLGRMKARLRSFQERTGDPWLLKWERE